VVEIVKDAEEVVGKKVGTIKKAAQDHGRGG
jgi:hypothetical protein